MLRENSVVVGRIKRNLGLRGIILRVGETELSVCGSRRTIRRKLYVVQWEGDPVPRLEKANSIGPYEPQGCNAVDSCSSIDHEQHGVEDTVVKKPNGGIRVLPWLRMSCKRSLIFDNMDCIYDNGDAATPPLTPN